MGKQRKDSTTTTQNKSDSQNTELCRSRSNNKIKYGLLLGRFQSPGPHSGHQHIINKIISDGLEPIIIVGSADKHDERNPYHPLERIHMIRLVYPGIKCLALNDSLDWDKWYNSLLKAIQLTVTDDLSETTIYLHEKLEDLTNFTFRGIDYTNESYCKLYELTGMHTTKLPISDIQIRAQSIRNDIESNKQFLHPLVYDYIRGR